MSAGLKEFPSKQIEAGKFGPTILKHWTPDVALRIHDGLEVQNWAPWLAASAESMVGRSHIFPEGQLFLESLTGEIMASVSTNRIQWDGQADSLPNWDTVAGEPTSYENTYIPYGNTLTLMSMNVNPNYIKYGLATALVHQVQELAAELGIKYIAGSFRPSEFGGYKAKHGVMSFEDYVFQTREDRLPVDAWIRSLTRNGMIPLKVDKQAMLVEGVNNKDFSEFMTNYHPEMWNQVGDHVWECGEVGQWTYNPVSELWKYVESNLWGIIPGTSGYDEFKKI